MKASRFFTILFLLGMGFFGACNVLHVSQERQTPTPAPEKPKTSTDREASSARIAARPSQRRPEAALQKKIKGLCYQLGSRNLVERDRAEAELIKLGGIVFEEIQWLARSSDPDLQMRGQRVIDTIRKNAFQLVLSSPKKTYTVGETIVVTCKAVNTDEWIPFAIALNNMSVNHVVIRRSGQQEQSTSTFNGLSLRWEVQPVPHQPPRFGGRRVPLGDPIVEESWTLEVTPASLKLLKEGERTKTVEHEWPVTIVSPDPSFPYGLSSDTALSHGYRFKPGVHEFTFSYRFRFPDPEWNLYFQGKDEKEQDELKTLWSQLFEVEKTSEPLKLELVEKKEE